MTASAPPAPPKYVPLSLTDGDIIVMRDIASQYYLEVGTPSGDHAQLTPGDLGTLQPTLFIRVQKTPIAGFWILKSVRSGQFLKMEQLKLTWTSVSPTDSQMVVDRSPYYFSYIQ